MADNFNDVRLYYRMTPEQAKGVSASTQTDIWALGITAIEMATGRTPHSNREPIPFMMNVLCDNKVSLNLPEEDSHFVSKMMRNNAPHDESLIKSVLSHWIRDCGVNILSLSHRRHRNLPAELNQIIISYYPPSLWSTYFRDFISCCLKRDPSERATLQELKQHPWIRNANKRSLLRKWIQMTVPLDGRRQQPMELKLSHEAYIDYNVYAAFSATVKTGTKSGRFRVVVVDE